MRLRHNVNWLVFCSYSARDTYSDVLICYLCSKLYLEVFSRGLNASSGDMKKVNECLMKLSQYVKDICKAAKEMYGLKCSIIQSDNHS